MNRITLGIDLDEVVFQYLDGLRTYMSDRGLPVPDGFPSSYSMSEAGWFSSDEEFHKVHGAAVDAGLYANLDVVPQAVETLWDLWNSGYRIDIVTSRFVNPGQHEKVVQQTAAALEQSHVPHSNLLFLSDKTRFVADAFVDDSPGNIIGLRNVGQYVVAFDLPYNRHIAGPRGHNWLEVREILREKFQR